MTDKAVTGFRAKLPNILTIGRIFSIPLLVAGILVTGSGMASTKFIPVATVGLFALACFTDYLDGYWARKWNVTSDFGRMIDPIADKLLVAACLIGIAITYGGLWFVLAPAMAIIGRDILVSGAREHAALKSRAMPPTNLAKWKTACEMLAIAIFLFVIMRAALGSVSLESTIGDPLFYIGTALLWLAAFLSVYTGSLYFKASLKD